MVTPRQAEPGLELGLLTSRCGHCLPRPFLAELSSVLQFAVLLFLWHFLECAQAFLSWPSAPEDPVLMEVGFVPQEQSGPTAHRAARWLEEVSGVQGGWDAACPVWEGHLGSLSP
jgi:hypothetical protein